MNPQIPDHFALTYFQMYGAAGKNWLAELPEKIDRLEKRWDIQVLPPYELSYNYVAPAVRSSGEPVVLKLGFPNSELTSEITALKHYAGRGIAKLLEGDADEGALLLERLEPGIPLERLPDDDEATRIGAQVMLDLWIPAPDNSDHQLINVEQWSKGFDRLRSRFGGSTGPFPAHLVERAEALYKELIQSPAPAVLLHGDLHHWNILSAQRAPWLALDPKGLIGEPAYEVGAFLRNPWSGMEGVKTMLEALPRRLDIFREILGFDHQRMLAWSLYQAVLSAWWTYEDHHFIGEDMIVFAEALVGLMKEHS